MAIKKNENWLCSYCKKSYSRQEEADRCRESHDLVYVALPIEDLNRLIQFLFTREEKLLKESIVNSLQNSLRNSRNTLDKKD